MKILYIPPRGLGDIIFSLPIIQILNEQIPDSKIFIPSKKEGPKKELLDIVQGVNTAKKFLPSIGEDLLERKRQNSFQKHEGSKKRHFEKIIYERYLNDVQYDLLLNARPFEIEGVEAKSNISRLKLKKEGFNFSDDIHMTDRFLYFADHLGLNRIFDFSNLKPKSKEVFYKSGRRIKTDDKYFVFHTGASSENKKWDFSYWNKLTEWANKKGYRVFILGSKREFLNSKKIEGENVEKLFSGNGSEIDIQNIYSLTRGSEAFVGGDTGITHIADASGAKTIGIYGPTPPKRFFPYRSKIYISRYEKDRDIKKISPKEVISKLEEIL